MLNVLVGILNAKLPLMVQKSGEKTTWDVENPLVNHGKKLPISTGKPDF